MIPPKQRRSTLGLMVLWQLFQEPMHVYRMQKMMEAQGKNQVVNVRSRASLYQALERLARDGLVEVAETSRREGYPDRVVYAITDSGREVAREWLRDALRSAEDEYPEFVAAVSVMFGLEPDDVREQLERRAERLQARVSATRDAIAKDAPPGLPRLFLLEEEYRMTMLEAEIAWLRGVIEDLREGRLVWSEQWLRDVAAQFLPPEHQHDQEDS